MWETWSSASPWVKKTQLIYHFFPFFPLPLELKLQTILLIFHSELACHSSAKFWHIPQCHSSHFHLLFKIIAFLSLAPVWPSVSLHLFFSLTKISLHWYVFPSWTYQMLVGSAPLQFHFIFLSFCCYLPHSPVNFSHLQRLLCSTLTHTHLKHTHPQTHYPNGEKNAH